MPFKSSQFRTISKVWNNAFDFFNGLIRKVSRNDRYFWTLTSVFLLLSIPITVFTVLQIRDLRSKAATNSPCYFVNSSGVAKNMDLTGDFYINTSDVNVIQNNYAPPGSSNYSSKYDINSDGYVNTTDQLAVIQKVPTTCYAYISYFTVNNTSSVTINQGSSVTLRWGTQHASPDATSISWIPSPVPSSGSYVVSPTTTTTYSLRTTNTVTTNFPIQSVTVNVIPLSATAVITANGSGSTTTVTSGTTVPVAWTVTGYNSCTVSQNSSTLWTGSGSSSRNVVVNTNTTFRLYCFMTSNPSIDETDTVTVNVTSTTPAPTVTLSADSTNIAYNTATTMRWTVSNATSCNATNGSSSWPGSKSASGGSVSTGNMTTTRTFNLSCTGAGGTTNAPGVTVNVGAAPNPVPTANIRANDSNGPITISYNRSVTLRWSSSNVTSCSVSPYGWTGTSGERSTPNLITPANTFTVSCDGSYGPVSDSVVVNVNAQIFPTVNITADNTNLSYNGSTTVRWTSSNASTCIISATGTSTTWSGTNSSHTTGNLTQSRTYTATCTRTNEGQTTRSVTVNVSPQGCLFNCTPTPVAPPANSGGSSGPTAPRVVPRSSGSRQPVATSDDIKLNFAANNYLQGAMEIDIKINETTFSQKASLGKEGGTFVLSPKGVLTKNKAYVLQMSSRNSLLQKITFTYVGNTSVDVPSFVTGEFNSDNMIDSNDLGILTETGILSGDSFYDINYDGVVNSVDYSLLLINQGKKGS